MGAGRDWRLGDWEIACVYLGFMKKVLFVCVWLLVGMVLGCQRPFTPAYYSPIEIVPDREEILALPLPESDEWTEAETAVLKSLWIGALPPVPASPSNQYADNPQAAALGHKLFFEPRISANNQISCAVCHLPNMNFSDTVPLSFGTRTTSRNAPTLVGAAYSPWLLWDGHKDSLWAQALEPIEHPDEHGSTRLHVVQLLRQEAYKPLYEEVFGVLPDVLGDNGRFPFDGGPVEYGNYRANWDSMTAEDQALATEIFVNAGKAIEAYERLLVPGVTPFDLYVQALLAGDEETMANALEPEAVAGLRLFIGEADCVRCHNGPLFTDNQFHNNGVPMAQDGALDNGRVTGAQLVLQDDFNCLSQYSDANPTDCTALNGLPEEADGVYAFRTPTLRYVGGTGPFMHQGQINTLVDVMHHYNDAPPAPLGDSDIVPLNLTDEQLYELETFVRSLSASPASPSELLEPPGE